MNSLLLAGDEAAALRFWTESGLARDPDALRQLGPRLAGIAERLGPRPAWPPSDTARPDAPAEPARALPRRPLLPGASDAAPEPARRERRPPPPPPSLGVARTDIAERLRRALAEGDTETVLRLWSDTRAAPLPLGLAGRVHAHLAQVLGGAMRRAIQRRDDEALVAAARAAAGAGVPIPPEAREAARSATRRREGRRALDAALASDDRTALTALALSGRLDELDRLPDEVDRAVRRALAWPHLERALAVDTDAAVLAAYEPDLFDDDPSLPRVIRLRVHLAQQRTAWLYRVRTALRRRDVAALREATADPPAGAEERLSRIERIRIDRLVRRDAAVERLLVALRDGPDPAVVAALNGIEAAGAPLPEALDWAAVRGVVDRLSLAQSIRDAAAADPPDYDHLARLLPAARAAVAAGSAPEGIDFLKIERDVLRAAHLARLRDALAAGDDEAIAYAATPDPYGALDRLAPEQRERVDRALRATPRHRSGGRPAPA